MISSNRLNRICANRVVKVLQENGKDGRNYSRRSRSSYRNYNAYQCIVTNHTRQHFKCKRNRNSKYNIKLVSFVYRVRWFHTIDKLNQLRTMLRMGLYSPNFSLLK